MELLTKLKNHISYNGFDLKMIALVTMLLDHFARVINPDLKIFMIIGRISFLLFAFLLVEGYTHSKNTDKYLFRLILWAFISEIPYDLALNGKLFNPYSQNIFFTLSLGLISLKVIDSNFRNDIKVLFIVVIVTFANISRVDYQYLGVLQVVFLYLFKNAPLKKYVTVAMLNIFYWGRLTIQGAAILAFFPIYFYNGKQGKKVGKWFYSFYAIHLLIYWAFKKIALR